MVRFKIKMEMIAIMRGAVFSVNVNCGGVKVSQVNKIDHSDCFLLCLRGEEEKEKRWPFSRSPKSFLPH